MVVPWRINKDTHYNVWGNIPSTNDSTVKKITHTENPLPSENGQPKVESKMCLMDSGPLICWVVDSEHLWGEHSSALSPHTLQNVYDAV